MSDLIIPDVPPEGIFPEEPPVAPPPYVSPFRDIVHTWKGTDGSVWDFTNPETGAFIVQEGVEGLHYPGVDYLSRETPNAPGASYHGYRVKPRIVTWSLYIYSDESSEHYYDLDARIWRSMQIGKEGVWRVTRPDGQFRELTMRVKPVMEVFDRDPGKFGWHRYACQFEADINPFWTIPTELPGSRVAFEDMDGKDFFGDGEGAPPYYISPDRIETTREFTNYGDEPVWPKVVITGPFDGVELTLGERVYTITGRLAVGETFTIETNPRRFAVTDHQGKPALGRISDWNFVPFPAGETIPISVVPQGTGGGTVIIIADPLFHRAW